MENKDCNRFMICVDHYRGFHVSWTGWKATGGSTVLMGQFVAICYQTTSGTPLYAEESAQIGLEQVASGGFTRTFENRRCVACGHELFPVIEQMNFSIPSEKEKANALERLKLRLDGILNR